MVGCVYRQVGLKERTWHASIHTSARKIFYENRRSDRTRWKFNSRRQVISGPRRATEVAELNFGRACTHGRPSRGPRYTSHPLSPRIEYFHENAETTMFPVEPFHISNSVQLSGHHITFLNCSPPFSLESYELHLYAFFVCTIDIKKRRKESRMISEYLSL